MFEDWLKEIIVFIIMLIPIWFINLVEISIKWRLWYTLGAAIGVFLFFETGINLRRRK